MRIVHVSDIHLTSVYYKSEWGGKLISEVNSLSPDVLLVTGDLTHDGYMHEYEVVKDFFKKLEVEVDNRVVLPGNHDARNEGYKVFEEIFGTRFPSYEDDVVAICGIDSSEPDIDDGHVGRENYPYISQKLSVNSKVRILALHHHLIPIPGTGREQHIPTDAGDVLELCKKLDINFVLSGHKHKPWIWRLEDTYLVTAGTATTLRLKGDSYPSFNIMEIEECRVVLKEVNISSGETKEILQISY